MMEIIDYQDTYSDVIDNEEANYWGEWNSTSIKETEEKYDVFKIILKDNNYAGHLYGNMIGDLFYFDIILITEKCRKQGIGTYLLENLINELKDLGCKNIVTTAEYINENIALEPLLLKFSFEKMIDINGFWGSVYPNVYCKDCCSLPCKCKAAVFLKRL
ncbi:MAG: GNAT family N-acetyltransferase [Erysipelotrichales bacterium]|nr:GNAT family N-acetyltransferase [Erysipelotrichales bacterium]